MDRRNFLKITAGTAGSIIVGIKFSLSPNEAAAATADFIECNAWLKISRDNQFIFILDRAEMGQGVMTALPIILAEELDVDPSRFKVEDAAADRRYDNSDLSMQVTGGSTSIHAAWDPLREAGFVTRNLMMKAAAEKWKVSIHDVSTHDGMVLRTGTAEKLSYGELCENALKLKPDAFQKEKLSKRFIGRKHSRLENVQKVTGTAQFGIDVSVPDCSYAYIIRPPVARSKVKSFPADEMKRRPGIRGVYSVSNGVAIVADTFINAKTVGESVTVSWEDNSLSKVSQKDILEMYAKAIKEDSSEVRSDGSIDEGVKLCKKTIEAEYWCPFLAHATMEPQNCTASVSKDRCEVWGPTQSPALAKKVAAKISEIDEENVFVHTTFLGGGFGRRLGQDYVAEAVEVAKAHGKAVHVIWTREQDMQHDIYRPASLHRLRGGIDEKGQPVLWHHKIACQSILSQLIPEWLPAIMPDWVPGFVKNPTGKIVSKLFSGHKVDDTSVEGAKDVKYQIPNLKVDYSHVEPGVPIGFWRSVGHSFTGFIVESFVDELANLAAKDPLEYRKSLLPQDSRARKVLELAAEKANWGKPKFPGAKQGIAQHESFRSFAAVVAEVSVVNQKIKVHRMVFAIDCGLTINPDMICAQIESAAIFGLSAALKGEITFSNGVVQQTNFNEYEVLRMDECPEIECHIVESNEAPTGIGEPGVPVVAPAVANAIFSATGKRLRHLPLKLGS